MSTQESQEQAIAQYLNEQTRRSSWGEERVRNLGATVEALMERRGFNPAEFDDLDQDDFELAA